MTNLPEMEACPREEITTPKGVEIHQVIDDEGRFHGHMLVIDTLEVVGSLAPFLIKFGLSPEGVQQLMSLVFMTSPVMIPVLLFIDTVGSATLIKLEDLLKQRN